MMDNSSSFFDAVDRMHSDWNPVRDYNDLELPAVYVHNGAVVWQFPTGEIVLDAEAGDRTLVALNSASDGDRAIMARRQR